jgi:metallo-beta-lactamase class B
MNRPQALFATAAALCCVALASAAGAQPGMDRAMGAAQIGGAADPGAPYVAKARALAGKDYVWTANLLCTRGEIVSSFFGGNMMQAADQDMQPLKVFDNLYYVGMRQVGAWAVTTPQGIILIDSLFPGDGQKRIEPGLRALGLRPQDIKLIILTHGHVDHFGGARYLQDKYGAHVAMSAADWDFMEKQRGDPATKPRRDQTIADGQVIDFGSARITAVLTPGHTPGSLGLIIPVSDHGQPHTAALWGGTMISAPVPMALREQYLTSMDHFLTFTHAAKVDVEIENHPYVGDQVVKLFEVARRAPGEPHPFVVGSDAVDRYFGILRTCAEAGIARAKVGLERTGGAPE